MFDTFLYICIEMKEEILKLKEEGKTFREIKAILGCSLSTISYHCNSEQKEKAIERTRKIRNTEKGSLIKKLEKVFIRKVHDTLKYRELIETGKFNYDKTDRDTFINSCLENPICYITKEKINLLDTKSYEIDHIIPVSKGGTNNYSNLGLCLRDVNRMKADLLLNDFYIMCEKVLNNKS